MERRMFQTVNINKICNMKEITKQLQKRQKTKREKKYF